MLYPLLFQPIVKPKVWGQETWSLSGYGTDQSVVSNGFLAGNTLSEVLEIYMDELVGEKVYNRYGYTFPLLFKVIDAQDDLSIQVHPDDHQVVEQGQLGKTEMWYVTRSSEDASIILGFKRDTTLEEIRDSLSANTITELLQTIPVHEGDVAYIPAGTVHALKKGTQVAEIQQTSDTTYRLYDYNRPGMDGKLRPLHVEEALEVLRCQASPSQLPTYDKEADEALLVQDVHFSTRRLHLTHPVQRDYARYDSFVVYMCLDGEATVSAEGQAAETLRAGMTCLIPACLTDVTLSPTTRDCTLLEILIE